jgi:hypothetical protein
VGTAQGNIQNGECPAIGDGVTYDPSAKENIADVSGQEIYAAERTIGTRLDIKFRVRRDAAPFQYTFGSSAVVLRTRLIIWRWKFFGNGRPHGMFATGKARLDGNGAKARAGLRLVRRQEHQHEQQQEPHHGPRRQSPREGGGQELFHRRRRRGESLGGGGGVDQDMDFLVGSWNGVLWGIDNR